MSIVFNTFSRLLNFGKKSKPAGGSFFYPAHFFDVLPKYYNRQVLQEAAIEAERTPISHGNTYIYGRIITDKLLKVKNFEGQGLVCKACVDLLLILDVQWRI